MGRCAWCKKKTDKFYIVDDLDGGFSVCEECKRKFDKHICIDCGEVIKDAVSIAGRCLKCSQVAMAKSERNRKLVQDGLGIDLYEEAMMNSGKVFTEDEYNTWLTFSPRFKVTKECKLYTRKLFLKLLICDNGGPWTVEEFDNNVDDIIQLLDRRPKEVFLENKKIVLIKPGVKLDAVVIDRSGKVFLLDKEWNIRG